MQQAQSDKIEGLDTRTQPEGHVIVSKQEQEELLKTDKDLENRSDDEISQVSMIPNPNIEKHLIEIENLKWQIQHESKLNLEMTEILKTKVSVLMAEQQQLQKTIKELNLHIEDQIGDKNQLNEVIEKLHEKIKGLNSEIVDLKNENDDLKNKGGALSPVMFDKLNS